MKRTSTSNNALPAVPAVWPGGFGLYKYSKQAVRRNWPTLLFLGILTAATSGLSLYYDSSEQHDTTVVILLLQLLAVFLSTATTYSFLQSVRGNRVSIREALNIAAQPLLFAKMLSTNVLLAAIMVLSLLAFVVPFFFVFPRLYLATYFVVDTGVNPFEAMRLCWAATQGHALKLWAIVAASVAMSLLLLTIIGIPFALYLVFMYGAANAVAYFFVLQQTNPPARTEN